MLYESTGVVDSQQHSSLPRRGRVFVCVEGAGRGGEGPGLGEGGEGGLGKAKKHVKLRGVLSRGGSQLRGGTH